MTQPIMKTKAAALLAATVSFCDPTALLAQSPEPGEIVYGENFDHSGDTSGMRGWYSFRAGNSATSAAAVEPGMGVDGSRALVFRFSGADPQGLHSYWLAALGRPGVCRRAGIRPENMRFSAFMGLPSEDNIRQISMRFVQGASEKPTWSATHKIDVDPMGEVVTLNIGDGEITGEFVDGEPVDIHVIAFTHEKFGFNREIEFVLDDVKIEVVQP